MTDPAHRPGRQPPLKTRGSTTAGSGALAIVADLLSRCDSRMRKRLGIRAAVVAVASVASFVAIPASGAFALTSNSARSVIVHLQNTWYCTLELASKSLSHGVWIKGGQPPAVIAPGATGTFGSESNGFMTDTEGWAVYNLEQCDDPAYNNAWVHVYWDNPYVGADSFSAYGPGHIIGVGNYQLVGDNAETSAWYWLNPY